ncbi:hypothetical protein R6Q59_010161 [Mikania micrantha]
MSNQRPTNPGLANNSSWNSSGFAYAPNTNTLDAGTMPSEQAQAARDKAAEVMAAVKAGDMERANALMGKDETKGRILPGMGWLKKKINGRGGKSVVMGEEVGGRDEQDVEVGKKE